MTPTTPSRRLSVALIVTILLVSIPAIVGVVSAANGTTYTYETEPDWTKTDSRWSHNAPEIYADDGFQIEYDFLLSTGIGGSFTQMNHGLLFEDGSTLSIQTLDEEDGTDNAPDHFRVRYCTDRLTNCTVEYSHSNHEIWDSNTYNYNSTMEYDATSEEWRVYLEEGGNLDANVSVPVEPTDLAGIMYGQSGGTGNISYDSSGDRVLVEGDGKTYAVNSATINAITTEPVSGTVTDTGGNGIEGATVTFEDTSTGNVTSSQTDANGDFVAGVPEGKYTMEISQSGYQTHTQNIHISGGDELGTFTLEESGLELDMSRYMHPGDSQTYQVEFTGEIGDSTDVTNDPNLTVTSSDTSIATVDDNELVGSETANGTTTITANYTVNGTEHSVSKTLTVAEESVENLDILPGIWRFTALIGDPTVQVMLLGTLIGVVGTRGASSFAGLSLMEMTMVMGFLGGWVGLGIVLVSTFTAIFIGLNLAANIDYSVRR